MHTDKTVRIKTAHILTCVSTEMLSLSGDYHLVAQVHSNFHILKSHTKRVNAWDVMWFKHMDVWVYVCASCKPPDDDSILVETYVGVCAVFNTNYFIIAH
jgi:hypothetical protein